MGRLITSLLETSQLTTLLHNFLWHCSCQWQARLWKWTVQLVEMFSYMLSYICFHTTPDKLVLGKQFVGQSNWNLFLCEKCCSTNAFPGWTYVQSLLVHGSRSSQSRLKRRGESRIWARGER